MTDPIIEEGIPPEEGKFCADCKYLLGVRYRAELVKEWRCMYPENLKENKEVMDLVTGILHYHRVFFYENIYDLRNLTGITLNDKPICGPEGRWYEEYKPPEYNKQADMPDFTEGNQRVKNAPFKPVTTHPSKLKNLKLGTDL